jgi:hypothetical protein
MSTKVIPKKRGPPGKGKDPLIALRMPPEERRAVEAWAAKQEGKLSLSKAIRRLVERGLASEPEAVKPRRTTKRGVTGL